MSTGIAGRLRRSHHSKHHLSSSSSFKYFRLRDGEDESTASSWLQSLIDPDSFVFDSVIGGVIALNAIVLGLETDYGKGQFVALEHFFCICFLLEMFARVRSMGFGLYFSDLSCQFDFFLVAIGVVELYIIPYVVKGGGNSSLSSIIRLIRMTRILRILRLFKMFRDLTIIMNAFFKAFSIVLWVSIFTALINYVVAIVVVQMIGHRAHEWGPQQARVEHWFGTIAKAMRTLFIVMTLSEWEDIAFVVSEQVPPAVVFAFFIFYILIASYTLVSLITGVICESLMAAERDEHDRNMTKIIKQREVMIEQLEDFFDSFDLDSSGTLSKEEMCNALNSYPNFLEYLQALEIKITEEEIYLLVERMADPETGAVGIDSFVETFNQFTGTASASTAHIIQHQVASIWSEVKKTGKQDNMIVKDVSSIKQRLNRLEASQEEMHKLLRILVQNVQCNAGPISL